MSRPYMQLTIVDLERIFQTLPKSLPLSLEAVTKLKALEGELRHRQTPRAAPLRTNVEKVLAGMGVESGRPAPAVVSAPAPAVRPADPPRADPEPGTARPPAPPQPRATEPAPPAMALQEALELLKVPANASWEELERRRRALVQQSSPSRTRSIAALERARLLEKAQLANAAMASILRARIGRSAG